MVQSSAASPWPSRRSDRIPVGAWALAGMLAFAAGAAPAAAANSLRASEPAEHALADGAAD